MSNVAEIEQAVQQLPPEELARFRDWFVKFDAAWDRAIDEDGKDTQNEAQRDSDGDADLV